MEIEVGLVYLYFILVSFVLILLSLVFFSIYRRKFNKIKTIKFKSLKDIEGYIYNSGICMLNSKKTYMSFGDEKSIYVFLSRLKNMLNGKGWHNKYAYYNFPKAFLTLGLLSNEKLTYKNLNKIERLISDKFVDHQGKLRFKIDKLDQSIFGLVFIKLYTLTNNNKYLSIVEYIYSEISKFKNEDNIYLYRKNQNILYIDSLGMVVPFLVEYSKIKEDNRYLKEAELQINYFLGKILENNDFPCHAYNLEKNIKLGSNNWSRGFAWFFMGLAYLARDNENYQELYQLYKNKIKQVSLNEYWSQFFGQIGIIDSSATIMIYFAMKVNNDLDINDLNLALKDSISTQYFVEYNSGDTMDINRYSNVNSQSELAQGLLIALLSD